MTGDERRYKEWLFELKAYVVHAADHANECRRRTERIRSEIAADPEAAATRLVTSWAARLARLQDVVKSKEWAGAAVELEVIDKLQTLPDDFTVISGTTLSLPRAVKYSGEWLKSAQVDHAVVGPTGIYLVETKAWSREFVVSDVGFNPYEQADWARFVCKCVLNDALSSRLAPKPYGIIAYAGSLPPKPTDNVVTAMRPSQLETFIRKDRGNWLNPEQVQLVVEELKSFLPHEERFGYSSRFSNR